MRQGAAVNDKLKLVNPLLQTFEEQVRPAQHLLKPPHNVLADWNSMYHGQFQLCHADHWGAACTRPRMLKLSKGDAPVDLSAIQKRPSIDVNSLLEPGWRSPTPLARCVVSSERTTTHQWRVIQLARCDSSMKVKLIESWATQMVSPTLATRSLHSNAV